LYVLAGIIILGLLTIVESLLNGFQKYDVWLGLDTLRTLFTFPLQLILLYSIGATLGLYFGLLSATILIFPIASLFITFSISTPSKATIKSVFDFAVYSLASGFIGTLYNNSSKLLLGFFFTPALVGNYEVAAIFAFPAFFIASVLKDALTPEISNLKSKNKNFLPSIQNSRNFASIIAIPVFAGSLGIGAELIATTYGTQYATASVFLAAICLLRVFMSQTRIIGSIFAGLDQPQENTKFLTMSFIILVLLTLPYIHFFSYIGIIYAMITAEAIRYLTSIVFLRTNYEIQVALLPKEIVYQLLSALTMTVTIKLLTNYIVPENLTLPLVLALIGIGASIYFATLIIISSYIRRTIFTLLNF
jgi:O-antigen/teichoic acid export membrane protein